MINVRQAFVAGQLVGHGDDVIDEATGLVVGSVIRISESFQANGTQTSHIVTFRRPDGTTGIKTYVSDLDVKGTYDINDEPEAAVAS